VLNEEGAIVFKEAAQVGRQRLDGLIDDDPVAVATPSASTGWKQRETQCDCEASVDALSAWIQEHAPHFKIL